MYVLDCRTATTHFPGIGRAVFNLARALRPLLGDHERLLLLRDPSAPFFLDLSTLAGERVEVVDLPLSPFSLRQQWALPPLLRSRGARTYHSPYYLMPFWPGVPAALTLHDIIPLRYPRYFGRGARLAFNVTARLATRAAERIFVVSSTTGRDIRTHLHVDPARIAVVGNAADPGFGPQPQPIVDAVRTRLGLPPRYVLYVGSNHPHKNLVRLVEAWAQLQPRSLPLVIAGAWDPRHPESRQRAEALSLGDAVRFLGPVVDDGLAGLYTGAELFVFPSAYEGFGLPVVEAMACGTPVACSGAGALAEVVGPAAALFDPLDVNAIAASIGALLDDPGRRASLRHDGLARAATFSWERVARLTLEAYRALASA